MENIVGVHTEFPVLEIPEVLRTGKYRAAACFHAERCGGDHSRRKFPQQPHFSRDVGPQIFFLVLFVQNLIPTLL